MSALGRAFPEDDMSERAIQPLISIALCTYNGAPYLREQLESLLAQTYRNIEIIAVDDHSADDTLAILKEYERRDARLRAVANSENLGFRKNFEYAMSLCVGVFVAPCDQDDVWLPDKLRLLIDAIGDHALAYCDSEFVDERGRSLNNAMSENVVMVSTNDPTIFAAGNCVSGHAMLFRRELLERALPVPDGFYYDWWLAAVGSSTGGIIYCDRQLVKYRLHDSNVTDVLRSRSVARQRGYRWVQLHEFRRRLEHLAALPGDRSPFIARLRDLWTAREEQWLSLALALFIFRHAPRVFLLRKPARGRLKYALQFTIGLRLKRLSNRYGYVPGTPTDTA